MDWLTPVLGTITTILCTVITAIIARKEIKDAKIKKLEDEAAKTKEEKIAADDKARDEKLAEIATGLTDVKQDITNIGAKQKDIEQELKKVNMLTKYNLEFTSEINNALINLSERIIDEESDDVMRKVMQNHRDKTTELQKKLFEITL